MIPQVALRDGLWISNKGTFDLVVLPFVKLFLLNIACVLFVEIHYMYPSALGLFSVIVRYVAPTPDHIHLLFQRLTVYLNESDHLVVANTERHKDPAAVSELLGPKMLGPPMDLDKKGDWWKVIPLGSYRINKTIQKLWIPQAEWQEEPHNATDHNPIPKIGKPQSPIPQKGSTSSSLVSGYCIRLL